jgi:aspartyl-tRNA(Asn)/glutamyl-tRNA(Gln) amidotransferase subunit A
VDLTASTVTELGALLQGRQASAREVAEAHLARIAAIDGPHSFEGSPDAINAWIRVYEERALADAARADERLAAGDAGPLVGVPLGLKDLYGVAGQPLTGSSRVVDLAPDTDADVAARLFAAGMVLLGHLHTHEFAAGGGTDQVGNPWDLTRGPGGSSGGSGAALASRTTPAATGTDTAGSLRIPAALCGVSTIKATRGALPLRGILPLSATHDHPGPMARTLRDCALLLHAMLGPDAGLAGPRPAGMERLLELGGDVGRPFAGVRLALSPRIGLVDVDPDVAEGFDAAVAAARKLGATIVDPPPPATDLDVGQLFLELVATDMLAWHAPLLAEKRELYRPSIRDLLEFAESRAMTAVEYADMQWRRVGSTAAWSDWLAEERIDAVLEPTVPIVAPPRGHGYDAFFTDEGIAYIALTHTWDWTGFPVASLPSGVGRRSGLPVGVSVIGAPGSEVSLLEMGIALQDELGTPAPPAPR